MRYFLIIVSTFSEGKKRLIGMMRPNCDEVEANVLIQPWFHHTRMRESRISKFPRLAVKKTNISSMSSIPCPAFKFWNVGKYDTHTLHRQKNTLDARGFLKEEPWSGDKRTAKREEVRKPLVAHDSYSTWSYHANRFELGSRPDPASWLEEPIQRTLSCCC